MATAQFLKTYCDDHDVDYLIVDDTGIGGGVVDRLRQLHLRKTGLIPFIPGSKAKKGERFVNQSAEVWFAMGAMYKDDALDTEDDPALIGQVSSREYNHDDHNRVRLQIKTSMYRSPDEADALAMTFAAPKGTVKIWV